MSGQHRQGLFCLRLELVRLLLAAKMRLLGLLLKKATKAVAFWRIVLL